jgi:hypothetical protein
MSLNDGVGGQQDLRSDGHRNLPAHGHLVTLCAGGRQHDAPGRTLCHALAVLDPPRVHGHHLRTQSRCAPIPARAHETDAPLADTWREAASRVMERAFGAPSGR